MRSATGLADYATVRSSCIDWDSETNQARFTSCNGGCDALAAIPDASAFQNQTACVSRCCSQFQVVCDSDLAT